jgi:hypothetical protein
MATVLEECTIEEQSFLVRFLWAKGLTAKDIRKEMFPVYSGKCLSRKAVHNRVEKRGNRFADDKDVQTEEGKWLRQESKNFCAAGFDALVKQWDKCIMLVEDMSGNKSFSRFKYHMLYVLYPFVTYLLTLPRIMWLQESREHSVYAASIPFCPSSNLTHL